MTNIVKKKLKNKKRGGQDEIANTADFFARAYEDFRINKNQEALRGKLNYDQAMKYQEGKDCQDIGVPYKFSCGNNDDLLKGTIYENQYFMLLANVAMPFPEWYGDDPENIKKAGMTFAHLLAVPKIPIYNAISLNKVEEDEGKHVKLLLYMRTIVIDFLKVKNNRQKVINTIFRKIICFEPNNKPIVNEDELNQFNIAANKFLDQDNIDTDLKFYFHIHPYQSINQLHMHCVGETLKSKAWEIHDHKNMPFDIVKNYLDPDNKINNIDVSSILGGGKKYKKSNEKIKINNTDKIIYLGQRGGKYIKLNNEYISLRKFKV